MWMLRRISSDLQSTADVMVGRRFRSMWQRQPQEPLRLQLRAQRPTDHSRARRPCKRNRRVFYVYQRRGGVYGIKSASTCARLTPCFILDPFRTNHLHCTLRVFLFLQTKKKKGNKLPKAFLLPNPLLLLPNA
jgi:hypothetical protein